jgi:uncharacterized Zn-binding protein involved in type VI secretion
MAVFGKLDARALANNVAVVNGSATITLASGSFLDTATNNYVNEGDILVLSGVSYIVYKVTGATTLDLHTTYAGSTATITAANALRRTAPKAVANYVVKGGDSNPGTLYFVDNTEAGLNENRVRGIDGPGWWVYKTFVDNDGNTRHKAEKIAHVKETSANAGDWTDDATVADVASAVTISGQPSAVTGASTPYTGTFAVTTSTTGTPGTLTYQWQYQTASQTTKWTNLTEAGVFSGTTGATLTLTAAAKATYDGYKFRVKINSAGGTEEVISNSASLTYA